ncbi:MAG: sensor histidine kinase [Dehalococcoidia bacterium]|nr:sensor histidine kinase [Dehalococcoidia bacterium]
MRPRLPALPPAWSKRFLGPGLVLLAALLLAGELRPLEDTGVYLRPDALAYLLYALVGLALLLRRRAPLATAVAVLTLSYTYQALGYVPLATLEVVTLVAVFTAAAHGRPLPRALPLAALALWLLAVNAASPAQLERSGLALMYVILTGAWFLGERDRAHRRYLALLAERADLLERQRDLEAAQLVAAERTRIARELHDVIAHGLGVVVVQSEAALHSPGAAAPETRRGLDAIGATARAALIETRRVLGMLRTESTRPPPQPAVDDLPALAASFTAAGLEVDLHIEGDSPPLDRGVELSIYRIVEEALTNALRHGGATHARVTLARIPHALELTVADDGRGATSETGPHDGHGLTGMRERVAMLHGALEVARAPEGGYLVRATLPLDATSERSAAALLRAAS